MHNLLERRGNHCNEAFMDMLYFGIGAALYVLFAGWCMITPQK
jgi:hypothetical protein